MVRRGRVQGGDIRQTELMEFLRAGHGFLSEVLKSARQNAAPVITGLGSCPEGLVSATLDGTIRFHPLL